MRNLSRWFVLDVMSSSSTESCASSREWVTHCSSDNSSNTRKRSFSKSHSHEPTEEKQSDTNKVSMYGLNLVFTSASRVWNSGIITCSIEEEKAQTTCLSHLLLKPLANVLLTWKIKRKNRLMISFTLPFHSSPLDHWQVLLALYGWSMLIINCA